ncbi:MAG: hypothetical protein EP343_19090 [Deltaproteobacteria bacterium]|nr:MAG: hypothetical protein EP343_19090 [Deltaproteobacteria bacterium]
MNKPRYLEYLLHLLYDHELKLICEARLMDESGTKDERIQRIVHEPTGNVADEDYLRVLPEPTLRRLCSDVGFPRVAERSGASLIQYATKVFRGVDWGRYVELSEEDSTSTDANPQEAWQEFVALGQLTVAEIRNTSSALALFVEWTGETPATLLQILNAAEPTDRVRDVLAEVWPRLEEESSLASPDGASGSYPVVEAIADSSPPEKPATSEPATETQQDPSLTITEPTELPEDEAEEGFADEEEPPQSQTSDDWENQGQSHWYLDDMMHELYLWLRQKKTVVTAPRRGQREILVRYTSLHDEQYGLLLHFDGTLPVAPEQLEEALHRSKQFQGKPIASLAVLAQSFAPAAVDVLKQKRRWYRNVGLFQVTEEGFQVIHQERNLRPLKLVHQFLEQKKQQQTVRAPLPDLSERDSKTFASSLHDAPTSRGFVPFSSVVVKRSDSSPPPSSSESLLMSQEQVQEDAFHALKPGQILAQRYVLLRQEEEGEVGKTFVARDQTNNRDCQLKVIRPELASNPEFQASFAQQFEQFRDASKHKQIGTYYDYAADIERGLTFFTTEDVEGQTLEQLLQESQAVPPLSLDQSLLLLQTIARALTHIHNRGFVHRDVKPDNIVLLPEGDWKLMDFGIITNISSTQPRLYTSVWESAERPMPRASDLHTPSGDMYALGALAYRLFTGSYPYPEDLKPPSAYNPGYSEDLDTLLLQALSSDPDDRPSSAALFIRHVRLALDDLVQEEQSNPSYESHSPLDSSHRSAPPQRPGSSSGFREFFIRWYSRFFRYSLTKQAIEQRRARLRFIFIIIGLAALAGGFYWWWTS